MIQKMTIMFGKTLFRLGVVVLAATVFYGPAWAQETSEEADIKTEIKAEMVDGKIVITLSNGEKRVIDLSEHKGTDGVVVELKQEHDGSETTRRSRAILVDPEGNQEVIFDTDAEGAAHSFEFADALPGFEFAETLPGFRFHDLQAADGKGRFMFRLDSIEFQIGINCEKAGEALKVQLGLDQGLVVQEVYDDTAAEKAGVLNHDILITANDKDLNDLDDLIKVIQEAGKEESEVQLSIIRKGKKKKVSVTPTKRDEQIQAVDSTIDLADVDGVLADKVQIQRVLPGLIQSRSDSNSTAKLSAEIAELRELVKQLRDEIRDK